MKGSAFAGTNLVVEPIRALGYTFGPDDPLDRLYERIGNARFVLLGEASHGTSEYYTWRARISRRLIEDKGFRLIAVEGDWPDCYRVNRYVKGYPGSGNSAYEVLHAFDRWPTWMWANWEVVALVEWMKKFNEGKPEHEKVGFYGLDVYSLWDSMAAVTEHLRESHPESVELAERAFQCFEPFNRDVQEYAWHTRLTPESCEDEVIEVLKRLRETTAKYPEDPESHFNAQQNAEVLVGAERYYRMMVRADNASWNVRDQHMSATLDRLVDHHGPETKAIVWEHNTHIGDARATDMESVGMVNIGQLVRDNHSEDGVVLVGFGGYEGSVIAGRKWGAEMEHMPVPPAPGESWEGIIHRANPANQLLIMEDFEESQALMEVRGHRAIGVVYHPGRERLGNYVPTILGQRYDAFLFFSHTHALHPVHMEPHKGPEPPETYPFGM